MKAQLTAPEKFLKESGFDKFNGTSTIKNYANSTLALISEPTDGFDRDEKNDIVATVHIYYCEDCKVFHSERTSKKAASL
jgi:hypothetical protein